MGRSLWGPSLRQGCRRAVGRSQERLCPPAVGKASVESEPGPQSHCSGHRKVYISVSFAVSYTELLLPSF